MHRSLLGGSLTTNKDTSPRTGHLHIHRHQDRYSTPRGSRLLEITKYTTQIDRYLIREGGSSQQLAITSPGKGAL